MYETEGLSLPDLKHFTLFANVGIAVMNLVSKLKLRCEGRYPSS